MQNELEHPRAVYYDCRDIRRTIEADDLRDSLTLKKARELELFNSTEEVRVFPRIVLNKRPHFVAKEKTERIILNTNNDEIHDRRVCDLVDVLKTSNEWKLVTYFWDHAIKHKTYKVLMNLESYRWQSETHRIFSKNRGIRHDVFGQSNKLSMSAFRPCIAIEVINTHYPSSETFNVFMQLSSNLPYMVLFDFIDRKNFFLKIESNTTHDTVIYSKLYIFDGIVWYQGNPTDIKSVGQIGTICKIYY